MLDIFGDLIDIVGDFFADNGAEILEGAATGLLIAGAVWVANLTADAISKELSKRQELKDKGAKSVLVKFIKNNDSYVELELAVLNAENTQIGTAMLKGKNVQVKQNQKIPLYC